MDKHNQTPDSREVESQESSKKSSKTARVLQNTEEAIRYGESATYEEMIQLMSGSINQFIQTMLNLSTEVQLLNEAYHAFSKDEWYQYNVIRKQK